MSDESCCELELQKAFYIFIY